MRYTRTDRLRAFSTTYAYFGGTTHEDAPLTLGECSPDKYYLEVQGGPTFYEQPDKTWMENTFPNPNPKKFESFQALLDGLDLELFLETGEKIESPEQIKTHLSQELYDSLPKKESPLGSFEDFNVMRHGFAGDEIGPS